MIYLAQSDTTVGFLSLDAKKINLAKNRPIQQKVLQTFSSFKVLNDHARIPKKHRKFVRHSKKTTFVLSSGEAFRVVDEDSLHHKLIAKLGHVYSSSANQTKKSFNEVDAHLKSDIIVKDRRGFFEDEASKMYKLSRTKIKRLR